MFITDNFRDYEFACRDGSLVPKEYHDNMVLLAKNLEIIRAAMNEPVYINSAYRTISHNAKVGGASRSYHLTCRAADIRCFGCTSQQLFANIEKLMDAGYITPGGLKDYGTFVHYDIRGVKTLFK